MKQVVQSVKTGALTVREVPEPVNGSTEVLVRTARSLLSPGTERAVRSLASASLLQKARARPDLVRQVVAKARTEGVRSTLHSVQARLDEEMPLGYSAAGVVVAVGEAVTGVKPGDRVATGSAGHAEYQVVPGHLAVLVPGGVSDRQAAFATLAAIALQGLRQAEVQVGSRIAVVGLGLLGQLTVRLALAAGCEVAAIDLKGSAVRRAADAGALGLVESGKDTTRAVLEWSAGAGVDAVLLTAATTSSAPAQRAPALARDRAAVVVVGDVGLELDRTPYYEKELDLRFSRSYGPGRYDRTYEEWAVPWPLGYVPFPEGRNLATYLHLVGSGRMAVDDLVTHEIPIERASEAYALLEGETTAVAVQLTYESAPTAAPAAKARGTAVTSSGRGIGMIGAGNFARATLVPALKRAGWNDLVAVASASGLSAAHLAERAGFHRVAATADDVIEDAGVDLVVVATRHDSHAELVLRALQAGKHVFCEKPLALTVEELDEVEGAWRASGRQLFIGFNRRHSLPVQLIRERLAATRGPNSITYRVNAGELPPGHWYNDRRQGGRLLGEVCHFVDACNALLDDTAIAVTAEGGGRGERLLSSDVALLLTFSRGSSAVISYAAAGHPGLAKERVELVGNGHAALIDDYRSTTWDGKALKVEGQDKGHVRQFQAISEALHNPQFAEKMTQDALHSMRVTLAAAESLCAGRRVTLR